jgi:hypothetical protein
MVRMIIAIIAQARTEVAEVRYLSRRYNLLVLGPSPSRDHTEKNQTNALCPSLGASEGPCPNTQSLKCYTKESSTKGRGRSPQEDIVMKIQASHAITWCGRGEEEVSVAWSWESSDSRTPSALVVASWGAVSYGSSKEYSGGEKLGVYA